MKEYSADDTILQLQKEIELALEDLDQAEGELEEIEKEWKQIISSHPGEEAEKIICKDISPRRKEIIKRRDEAKKKSARLADEIKELQEQEKRKAGKS